MIATFSLLLAFLVQFFLPRHNAQLRLLKAQIAILRIVNSVVGSRSRNLNLFRRSAMTASVTHGRALRYAGISARGLLHHHPGHCLQNACAVDEKCYLFIV